MTEVFPCIIKVVEIFTGSGVQNLGISDVAVEVSRVQCEYLLVAVLSLLVVMFREVQVGQLQPRLIILLVVLQVFIEQDYCLVDLASVSLECDKSLDSLEIAGIDRDQLIVYLLCLVEVLDGLVEHREQPHVLRGLRDLASDNLQEKSRPLHLLDVQSCIEEFFNQVQSYITR